MSDALVIGLVGTPLIERLTDTHEPDRHPPREPAARSAPMSDALAAGLVGTACGLIGGSPTPASPTALPAGRAWSHGAPHE